MFLNRTMERNQELIRYAIELHQAGEILPDTYVIDSDAIVDNAAIMLKEAKKYNIQLWMMTKQFGRNPIIAKRLMDIGFKGAVAVDYREALTLGAHGIPIAHVGHLVQTPQRLLDQMVELEPELITVYSVDKARQISEACRKTGRQQDIMLRVIDDNDTLYPGQYGGFPLADLAASVEAILQLPHVRVNGITSFPCFLYNPELGDIMPTNNVNTVQKAARLLSDRFGIEVKHLNMPSATCTHNIHKIYECGGTEGEPGHGLLGTTPMHADTDLAERPAILYVSEISHQLGDKSYCYGGGYYRRTQIESAMVAKSLSSYELAKVQSPEISAIDYYLELEGNHPVGDTVIMAFRTQIFVTRSAVAVVEGLSTGNPKLSGIYDSQGRLLKEV